MDLSEQKGEPETGRMMEVGKAEEEDGGQQLKLSLNGAANRTGMEKLSSSTASGSQLTIFYGGKVCVYDAVSLEKAQAIMLIAAAAAAATKTVMVTENAAVAGVSPALTRSLSLQSTSIAAGQSQVVPEPNAALYAELPVARRLSLQRFMEKRRDRMVSRAPYVIVKSSGGMETSSMDVAGAAAVAGMEVAIEGKP